jgi:hypothetical protein
MCARRALGAAAHFRTSIALAAAADLGRTADRGLEECRDAPGQGMPGAPTRAAALGIDRRVGHDRTIALSRYPTA